MRRNAKLVPKADSLCLFCASRLNLSNTSSARLRLLHTEGKFSQRSQATARVHNTQESANGGWGHETSPQHESSRGWGSSDTFWDSDVKILGNKQQTPPVKTTKARQPQQVNHHAKPPPSPASPIRYSSTPSLAQRQNPPRAQPDITTPGPEKGSARRIAPVTRRLWGSTPRVDRYATGNQAGSTPPADRIQRWGRAAAPGIPENRASAESETAETVHQSHQGTAEAASRSLSWSHLKFRDQPEVTLSVPDQTQLGQVPPQSQKSSVEPVGRAEVAASKLPDSRVERLKAAQEERLRRVQAGERFGWVRGESNQLRPPEGSSFQGIRRTGGTPSKFVASGPRPAEEPATSQKNTTSTINSDASTRQAPSIDDVIVSADTPEPVATFVGDQHDITGRSRVSRKFDGRRMENTAVNDGEYHEYRSRTNSRATTSSSSEVDPWHAGSASIDRPILRADRSSKRGRLTAAEQVADPRLLGRKGAKRNMKRRDYEENEDQLSDAAIAKMERHAQRKAEKAQRSTATTPVVLPDFISIGNLAALLRVRAEVFARKLQELGFEGLTNDHVIGAEDAGLIAQELNFEPSRAPREAATEDLVAAPEPTLEDKELMLNRPPVITIMGHVDHGKTTLLDFLRKSSVAASEYGGITQHIGAFTVEMPSGRTITFLDTPGHSAFLEMRQRGASVTDIVILVVAADDSVKPQTLEAIKHAQGAGVPMIVAISKVDKEQAEPERVKRDLAAHGVEVEDFGGDVQAIPVSGKTGEGMTDLEDAAIALADILDVKADTSGQVEGWVLESRLKPQGRVATVLMKRGTLRVGTILVAGTTFTKVRTLRNEAGQFVHEATPGQPVEVDGWDDTPDAGAQAIEAPNMQRARDVCELRQDRAEQERIAATVSALNEQRAEHREQRAIIKEQEELEKRGIADDERSSELQAAANLAKENATSKFTRAPIIIRADVDGSAEAVSAAIQAMGSNDIRPHVIKEEAGFITQSDVELAETAEGIIVSFGVAIPPDMRRLADAKKVQIIDGNVIYRITEAVKTYLEDKLPPIRTPRVLGEADIAQVFEYKIMKGRARVPVAGCRITNGVVEKGRNAKVVRDGKVVHDGLLTSLKNVKRDVNSMQKGTECGMRFGDFTDFEIGDKVQVYEILEERRKL